MKPRLTFGIVTLLMALSVPAGAAPPKKTNAVAPVEIPRSEFVIPKTASEGRDPFFPNSTSIHTVAAPTAKGPVGTASLILNGLTPNVAYINGVAMKVGEDNEVKIPGGRVTVHLVEIRIHDDLAVVKVNDETRELRMKQ